MIIMSFLFVLIQTMILATVTYESYFTPCTTHTDCQLGQFCSRDIEYGVLYKNARCYDCSKAPHKNETSGLYYKNSVNSAGYVEWEVNCSAAFAKVPNWD